jgi:hypothetical protein
MNAALRSSSGVDTTPDPKITGAGIGFVEEYGCAVDRWPTMIPEKTPKTIIKSAADFIGGPPEI